MEASQKIPVWSEKSRFEQAMTALFAVAAAVMAVMFVCTVFVSESLWIVEELSLAVLMITDALVRWNHCSIRPKVEMCLGTAVMVLTLALMWL